MKPALYLVTIEVSPSAEAAWNEWHEKVHVPEVMRQPGFLSCRKWRDPSNAEILVTENGGYKIIP